jgi:hypothetical protein
MQECVMKYIGMFVYAMLLTVCCDHPDCSEFLPSLRSLSFLKFSEEGVWAMCVLANSNTTFHLLRAAYFMNCEVKVFCFVSYCPCKSVI